MPITLSIALYCSAWLLLVWGARTRKPPKPYLIPALLSLALLAHGYGSLVQIIVPQGYHFAFPKILSVFFLVANLLIFISATRKPLRNLFLITLPITVAALLGSLYASDAMGMEPQKFTFDVAGHILLSILAYSTMIIATAHALLLAYQDHRIRNKHPTGLASLLPPLQTMESLLFELLWVGQALLTLVIITGVFHIVDLGEQHLYHKIVFTIIAWIIYAILLWGHHQAGWRGNTATRWTLAGFFCLFLAYLGTKIVLELILA